MAKKISSLAVGSRVRLSVGGDYYMFLVVNQGKPSNSSLYPSSCNGTWLLMESGYTKMVYDNSISSYESSTIHTYLNETFYAMLDERVQAAVKQVKIPYRWGSGVTVYSGSNGLSAKVFLLSGYELGLTSDGYNLVAEGAKLSYFTSGESDAAMKLRRCYMNAIGVMWWTRSPVANEVDDVFLVREPDSLNANNGSLCQYPASYGEYAVRPAMVLDSNTLVTDTVDGAGCYSISIGSDTTAYVGNNNNLARGVTNIYIGDSNNVARKIVKAYVGDSNNKARLCYSAGAGDAPPISDFVMTSSTTWTCPYTGPYRFIAIGKGGNGGSVGYSVDGDEYDGYIVDPVYNGGGGGGGVAVYTASVKKGAACAVAISSSQSSVTVSGVKIYGNAGGAGGGGTVGAGGSAGGTGATTYAGTAGTIKSSNHEGGQGGSVTYPYHRSLYGKGGYGGGGWSHNSTRSGGVGGYGCFGGIGGDGGDGGSPASKSGGTGTSGVSGGGKGGNGGSYTNAYDDELYSGGGGGGGGFGGGGGGAGCYGSGKGGNGGKGAVIIQFVG